MTNETDRQIERVRQKLAQVQVTWQNRPNEFGVQKHQFRMNPILSEDMLLAFETRHGIHLPEDYRAFLRNIGNGGAGPYYGILSLEEWASGDDETDDETLSRPCLLSEHLPLTVGWEQMLPPEVKNPYQGTITMCSQGCSFYALLVVSGPARGRVVYIDQEGQQPPYFLREPDFLSWYERWLDETIGGYDLHWFGYRMGGSEADLLHILDDAHTSSTTRSDALVALTKFPQLCTSIPAVLAGLQDADAEVRKSAALVVARFSIAEASPFIRELVTDADPTVRESALKALVKLPHVPWLVVQQMLRDPDTGVGESAWRALHNARRLTIDDILMMLSSDDLRSRRHAACSLKNFPGDRALDVLPQCLQDSDLYVRLYSVQSLAELRSRKSIPMLTALLATEREILVLGNIIRALTMINDQSAVPALIDAARHTFAGVRYDAAKALGTLGDRRAIPALRLLCDDTVRPEERYANGGPHFWPDRVCDQARRSLQSLE